MPRRTRPASRRWYDDRSLITLAETQDNVVSRGQLRGLGWTHDRVEAEVAAGRWATFGRQAVTLHRGPLPVRQRHWIAVLNGGPRVALAGATAAQEFGLRGLETDVVHIVVARGDWVPSAEPGVKVHISRRFSMADVHPARSIPTVRLSRAIVDAAVWSGSPRRACLFVIAAVQQRLTMPDLLREELVKAGQVRHRRLLWAVLADVEGGSHALSELDFARLCRRKRLPTPTRQERRRDGEGRVRYLDASFVAADGRAVNVEVDGSAHYGVVEAWSDMRREVALLSRGVATVRVPSAMLRINADEVADQLRGVLDGDGLAAAWVVRGTSV